MLILNGEMSAWSIEHAWKTNPATLTEGIRKRLFAQSTQRLPATECLVM